MPVRYLVYVGFRCSAAPSGEEVYKAHCAACHDQNTARIPPRDALQKLPATRILRTLDFGLMMNIAYTLKRDEREAVASFLGVAGGTSQTPTNTCLADKSPISGSGAGNRNGWSPSLDNARYMPTEKAGISIGQMRNLKLKWARIPGRHHGLRSADSAAWYCVYRQRREATSMRWMPKQVARTGRLRPMVRCAWRF